MKVNITINGQCIADGNEIKPEKVIPKIKTIELVPQDKQLFEKLINELLECVEDNKE